MVSEILESDAGNLETSYTLDLLGRETASRRRRTTTTTVYDCVGQLLRHRRRRRQLLLRPWGKTGLDHRPRRNCDHDPVRRTQSVHGGRRQRLANPSLPTEDVATTTYYDAVGNGVAFTDASGISSRSIYNVRGLSARRSPNSPTLAPVPPTILLTAPSPHARQYDRCLQLGRIRWLRSGDRHYPGSWHRSRGDDRARLRRGRSPAGGERPTRDGPPEPSTIPTAA